MLVPLLHNLLVTNNNNNNNNHHNINKNGNTNNNKSLYSNQLASDSLFFQFHALLSKHKQYESQKIDCKKNK